jgi:enhancing lycopene biosynthesis protein 2
MSILTPPCDFSYQAYLESIGTEYTALKPIVINDITKVISIGNASGTSSGIVSHTGTQTFAGVKIFNSVPSCSSAPSSGSDLTNKAYVDTLVTTSLSFKESILGFHNFSSQPSPLNTGDRYISATTVGDYHQYYIYQYQGSSTWTEYQPEEGWAVYDSGDSCPSFPNQLIMFNGTAWVQCSSVLSHDSLIGVHQNCNTSASPSFVGGSITGTTQSTSSSTGALIVAGGAGIANSLFVGGITNVVNTTASTSTSTGALIVAGGIGCNGGMYVKRFLNNPMSGTSTGYNSSFRNMWIRIFQPFTPTDANRGSLHLKTESMNNNIYVVIGMQMQNSGTIGNSVISCLNNCNNISDDEIMKYKTAIYLNKETNQIHCYFAYDHTNHPRLYQWNYSQGSKTDYTMDMYTRCGDSSGVPTDLPSDPSLYEFLQGSNAISNDMWYSNVFCDSNNDLCLNSFGNDIRLHSTDTVRILNTADAESTSTGALIVSGGVGIAKNLYVGGSSKLVNTTESTSTSTGGLIVSGGVGVAKNLFVGSTVDSTSTSTGSLVESGGVGIAKNLYVGGVTNVVNTTASTSVSTGALVVSGGLGVTGSINASSINYSSSSISGTDDSTSTSTGALVVSGGVGVAKNLFVGSTVDSTSTSTGSLVESGGVGIAKNLYVGGSSNLINTTESTSTSTGALIVDGGVGVAKNLYVGGVTNLVNTTCSTSVSTGALVVSGGLGVTGSINASSINYSSSSISGTADSTSTSTGALIVAGGAGIANSLFVGGITNVVNTTASTSTSTGALIVAGGIGCNGGMYVKGFLNSPLSGTTTGYSGAFRNMWIRIFQPFTPTTDNRGTLHLLSETLNHNFHIVIGMQMSNSSAAGNSNICCLNNCNNIPLDDNMKYKTAIYLNKQTNQLHCYFAFDHNNHPRLYQWNYSQGSKTEYTMDMWSRCGDSSDVPTDLPSDPSLYEVKHETNAISNAMWYSNVYNDSNNDICINSFGDDIRLHSTETVRVLNTNDADSNSTGALIVSGGVGIAKNLYVGGVTNVVNTTASTSVSTGALVVSGGVGVAKNLFVGSTVDSTSTSTGSLVESGGVGIAKNLYVGGSSNLINTTDSTSTSTGALIVAGGIASAKRIWSKAMTIEDAPVNDTDVVRKIDMSTIPLSHIYLTAPDLDTSNAFFMASMAISLIPEIGTDLTYTTSGSPTITNGKLVMTAQDEVKYNGSNFNKTSMTVKLMYRPNYDNSPIGPQILFKLVSSESLLNNLYLFHASNGNLSLVVHDVIGDKMIELLESWAPTSGKDYEIEFALGTSGGITSCYLFIDGILKKSAVQAAFTRHVAPNFYIGDSSNYHTNFSIWDIVAFPSILHTANYTPGYSLHGIINKRLTSLNTVQVAENLNVYGASHFHGSVTIDTLSETILDQSFAWGPWDKGSLPDPGDWYLSKIGNKVFLSAPQFIMASIVDDPGSYIQMGVNIPEPYRPNSAITFPITVINGNIKVAGHINISTSGVMYIRPEIYGSATFNEDGMDAGYFAFNIFWDTRV